MVDDSVTKNIAYFIFAISFFVMIYFISQQARKNRLSAIDQHAPKVAGHDILDGGAKNPKAPTLFQVVDVDTGVINWVNADLVSHIVPTA